MEEPYTPCSAEFLITEKYPHPNSEVIDQINLSEREEDAYWAFYEEFNGPQPRHQLLVPYQINACTKNKKIR
jgi:hypothetical protein